jgi:hypothetical protein
MLRLRRARSAPHCVKCRASSMLRRASFVSGEKTLRVQSKRDNVRKTLGNFFSTKKGRNNGYTGESGHHYRSLSGHRTCYGQTFCSEWGSRGRPAALTRSNRWTKCGADAVSPQQASVEVFKEEEIGTKNRQPKIFLDNVSSLTYT